MENSILTFTIFTLPFTIEYMRRPERMSEVLREEITEIVGYELEDPRLLQLR